MKEVFISGSSFSKAIHSAILTLSDLSKEINNYIDNALTKDESINNLNNLYEKPVIKKVLIIWKRY